MRRCLIANMKWNILEIQDVCIALLETVNGSAEIPSKMHFSHLEMENIVFHMRAAAFSEPSENILKEKDLNVSEIRN